MKIYVASSWRNAIQPFVVSTLRTAGLEVYDFREPLPRLSGFTWREVDLDWQKWSSNQYIKALQHPIADAGYNNDFNAMKWADACVLILPCGRSAHLEAGWFVGVGKALHILMLEQQEPELMYKMASSICTNITQLLNALES